MLRLPAFPLPDIGKPGDVADLPGRFLEGIFSERWSASVGFATPRRSHKSLKCDWAAARSVSSEPRHLAMNSSGDIFPYPALASIALRGAPIKADAMALRPAFKIQTAVLYPAASEHRASEDDAVVEIPCNSLRRRFNSLQGRRKIPCLRQRSSRFQWVGIENFEKLPASREFQGIHSEKYLACGWWTAFEQITTAIRPAALAVGDRAANRYRGRRGARGRLAEGCVGRGPAYLIGVVEECVLGPVAGRVDRGAAAHYVARRFG